MEWRPYHDPGAVRYSSHYLPGKVLVVSAFPLNRIVIAHSIERIYRKPISVEPRFAIDALNTPDLALVVLDITGQQASFDHVFSALKEIRTHRNTLPRILLIADEAPFDGPIHIAMSADAIITKPFATDRVQSTVDRILRSIIPIVTH